MNDTPAQLTALEPIFENVLSVALAIGGILLFIMLVIGGFRYISAGADAKSAQSAQHTITFAIYGVIFLALAYLFLRLIAGFTGVEEILNFSIDI